MDNIILIIIGLFIGALGVAIVPNIILSDEKIIEKRKKKYEKKYNKMSDSDIINKLNNPNIGRAIDRGRKRLRDLFSGKQD